MKKIAIAILVMGLLGTGLWWMIRRKPGTVPPVEENANVFRVAAADKGTLIRYEDPQTPLRALRWLPPLPNGELVVQVVTQSDRQQIALFKNGVFQDSYLVPKPVGVRDGFFRLAELQEARVVDGDAAILLYAVPGAGDDEPPLVMALDLKTKDIRWIHRAKGEHLAMADAAVYLYGSKTPPVKLPLALASGEKTSATGARSSAKVIELPPEVQEVSDLKPTGAWTFLVAHKGGPVGVPGLQGLGAPPAPRGQSGVLQGCPGLPRGKRQEVLVATLSRQGVAGPAGWHAAAGMVFRRTGHRGTLREGRLPPASRGNGWQWQPLVRSGRSLGTSARRIGGGSATIH